MANRLARIRHSADRVSPLDAPVCRRALFMPPVPQPPKPDPKPVPSPKPEPSPDPPPTNPIPQVPYEDCGSIVTSTIRLSSGECLAPTTHVFRESARTLTRGLRYPGRHARPQFSPRRASP